MKIFPINLTVATIAFFLALILLSVGIDFNSVAGNTSSTSTESKQMEKTIILKVSVFEAEADFELGRITFNSGEQPQLAITTESPKAERLKAAWKDIQSQPSIRLTKPQRDPTSQNEVMREATTNVSSTDPDYWQAVWSTLERQYGFVVDNLK